MPAALKTLSNLPPTPGRQVKYLREELGKKENENDKMKGDLADLSKALEKIKIVNDKVASDENPFSKCPSKEDNDKKGKKRDKNAPAPAMTAYKFFTENVKKNNKEKEKISGADLQKMWKECLGEERQKYVDMATKDKERFEKEDAVYQKISSEKALEEKALEMYYQKQKQELAMEFYEAHMKAQQIKEKNKKKAKDPDAPKGACSSYMFFCKEKREEITKKHSDKSPKEISKILGEEWQKLDKGKGGKKGAKKYEKMADEDKARYETEKAVYDKLKAERELKAKEEREMQLQKDKEEAMKLLKNRGVEMLLSNI